nr:retrovirus-related Pol polyprotein from transposon TNT 1-94 [Tanacetum cinerariifolium]
MDVKTEFLNSLLKEEVFVSHPDVDRDFPDHVYRLKKALYDLKQSLRAWHAQLRNTSKRSKGSFVCLKHSINMGLWYSNDSGFKLIAYLDADHVGCHDDCKSTYGGIQFLRDKLVSWSSKKQDCAAMSTAEAKTKYELADLFTKALPKERFVYLVHGIGMRCMTPTELERLAKLSS